MGDTGSGKTYLENRLLRLRSYVIFLRTKAEDPKDDPMDSAWRRVRRVQDISTMYGYWLLEPEYDEQRVEGLRLFNKARREGNWTIAVDELLSAQDAGLEKPIRWGMTQGRAGGTTMVVGTQRPTSGSPLMRYVLSQATHSFLFQIDGRDAHDIVAKTISPRIEPALAKLNWRKHQFVYYHRRERRLLISDASHIQEFM